MVKELHTSSSRTHTGEKSSRDFMESFNSVEAIITRIIALNHAWKVSRETLGAKNDITEALRRQKSSWQASLIRFHENAAYLKVDNDNTDGEVLLSVRLHSPVNINGVLRRDAEHIPLRIAKELFSSDELESLIR